MAVIPSEARDLAGEWLELLPGKIPRFARDDSASRDDSHMVLNTGMLGFDGATEIVVGRARAMWWR